MFEDREGLGLSNCRKILEKISEGMTTFEIIEERLDWNSGSAEYGGSAQNLRIGIDCQAAGRHRASA